MYAVDHLSMTVPQGAIYGFIGENGSGKSTTEKLICGHLVPDGGEIKLFGRDYTDPGVRVRVGALIENAGCFPGSSGLCPCPAGGSGAAVPAADEKAMIAIAPRVGYNAHRNDGRRRNGAIHFQTGDPAGNPGGV